MPNAYSNNSQQRFLSFWGWLPYVTLYPGETRKHFGYLHALSQGIVNGMEISQEKKSQKMKRSHIELTLQEFISKRLHGSASKFLLETCRQSQLLFSKRKTKIL